MSTRREVTCDCCGESSDHCGHAPGADMTCYCPVEDVFSVISRKWGIQIIGLLNQEGTLRTKELREKGGFDNPTTLSSRLRELEEAGLLHREQYDESPPRVEYTLTEHGTELANRLQPMLKWAEEN